jgi:hypothetical protein
MKKIFLFATVTIIGISALCQEKKEHSVKPTAAAQEAFKKGFPSATQAKWMSEDKDYEVVFKKEKMEMSAVYTPEGRLKETEEKISKADLPATVVEYIKQHYNKNIKSAEKATNEVGVVTYEIEVGEVEVIFDQNGKFIKEEKEKDEDKD